jgi:S-adenosylmethionine:tRNA ribosyltransferase-isomerase
MNAASVPRHGPRGARLLVVDAQGQISHHAAADLPRFIGRDDVIIANDAATLPASLAGIHQRTGRSIEVRLAGRTSLAPQAVRRFIVVVFGEGDYHTLTERRHDPPRLWPDDRLTLVTLDARVVRVLSHPRLIEIVFDAVPRAIWECLSRYATPIQYAHVAEPLEICDTWTAIANQPVAFEAPSAGFILDWATVRQIKSRGARFATITHAAGLSSTGDPELDRLLPFDEPYEIPASTAALIADAQRKGRRVIAVGTTVVRALEHSAWRHGYVAAGPDLATNRIGPTTSLRIVDGILSGMHERASSHYDLLRAFQADDSLDRMSVEAERHDYRSHEFGDAVFVSRDANRVTVDDDQRCASRMTA